MWGPPGAFPGEPMNQSTRRADLLRALESVEPGLLRNRGPRSLDQGDYFVFQGGRVKTYNEDIFCQAPTGLPAELEVAVPADPLLKFLRKVPGEEVRVKLTDSRFVVSGNGERAMVRYDKKIVLPVEQVERPVKDGWAPVPGGLLDVAAAASECTSSDESMFAINLVHVGPDRVESTDNAQAFRATVETGLTKDAYLQPACVKNVAALGMLKVQETKSWVHFRNGNGVTLSARRYDVEFPNLDQLAAVKGRRVALPKNLKEAAERAEIFSAENPVANRLIMELVPGELRVRAEGSRGEYTARWTGVKYKGPEVLFLIAPKILSKICERYDNFEVADFVLKVTGENFVYVSLLGRLEEAVEEGGDDE